MNSVVFLCGCMCLMALMPSSEAYENRVPVNEQIAPNVCTDMFPSGHGVVAQTTAAPFKVVANQACYKEGQAVQVVVQTLDGNDAKFEGLFVQARQTGSTTTMGTFTVTDSDVTPLTCTGTTGNSAVGHNQKLKKRFRSVKWTPPIGFRLTMNFRATVVKEKEEFWVGLVSQTLTYDASCVAGPTLSKGSILHAAPYCLALALASFVMAIFAW